MREWDFEMHQVVDVDRHLLWNDADVVGATSLMQCAGELCRLGLLQPSPLYWEEVLFFKSKVATFAGFAAAS